MDIPLIESGIIINPNFLSRLLAGLNSLWAYCALAVAAVAAFSSLAKRTRLVFFRFPRAKSVIPHPPTYFSDTDDVSSSDSYDDTEVEDEDDDDHEDDAMASDDDESDSFCGNCWVDEGRNGDSEERDFWPELVGGGAIVKVWDGLGLGFRKSGAEKLISLMDLSRGDAISSFLAGRGQIPAAFMESPAVVLSGAADIGGNFNIKAWDSRTGGEASSVAFGPRRRRRVEGIAGGEGRVFVRDDAGEVSLVDLRNGKTTAVAGETFWDAGAVFVDGGGDDEGKSGVVSGSSVAAWCRNAVRCFPVLPSSR
ncbi:YVTN repeat-like/Quinoprotein amine dehydrogenase protein [Dioscorea alata]|uniref:YVTN repeat-like/Quinoprotein amine dehydrogenase protein n=1 Tax=Dioscorea alata TaxID=55571 RepID=A0ACB7UE62_DIOAL|nr:YVTN repeat-like/Quinoprotein amine dehydrogenase protein [Dioscorea alata]